MAYTTVQLFAEEAKVACGNTAGIHDPVVDIVDLCGLNCGADRNPEVGHAEDAVRAFERCSLCGFLLTGFCEISAGCIPAAAAVDAGDFAAPAADEHAAVRCGEVLCIPEEEPDAPLVSQFFEPGGKFLHVLFCKDDDLQRIDAFSLWGGPCSKGHQVGNGCYCFFFRCHAGMLGDGEDKGA